MELNEMFNKIINDYFEIMRNKSFKVSINLTLTNDIYDKRMQIGTKEQKEDIGSNDQLKNWANNLNATLVNPDDYDGTYNVLMNEKYFLDNYGFNNNWVGTICHELTHICDFIDYANITKQNKFSMMLKHESYKMFYFWTEYNARRIGYRFLRKYTYVNMSVESQLEFIMHTELPFHVKDYNDNYILCTSVREQIYSTMQFLGHLKTWKELFPEQFTALYIETVIGNLNAASFWINKIFEFLDENDTFEKAYPRFSEMGDILATNFAL